MREASTEPTTVPLPRVLAARGRHALLLLTHPIARVTARRLTFAVPLLFVVSALTFMLVSLVPGDPAVQLRGPNQPPQVYRAIDEQLGLNHPLYDQYWRWLDHALHGDLGTSFFTKQPVTEVIRQRLSVTLSLVLLSFLLSTIVGVWFGVFAAVRGGAPARIVDALSLVGWALPSFWVGAVLIAVFAVRLHWLPAIGYVSFRVSVLEWARSLVLPVVALAVGSVAVLAKQTRQAMLDTLSSEYIRMAWANGLSRSRIYFQLAVKPAGIQLVTLVGLQAIGMLLGTAFIETLFALPGIGSTLVSATTTRDLPVVEALTVFFALMIVVINFVTDLLSTLFDPRVRVA